jgi:hypothetical protein
MTDIAAAGLNMLVFVKHAGLSTSASTIGKNAAALTGKGCWHSIFRQCHQVAVINCGCTCSCLRTWLQLLLAGQDQCVLGNHKKRAGGPKGRNAKPGQADGGDGGPAPAGAQGADHSTAQQQLVSPLQQLVNSKQLQLRAYTLLQCNCLSMNSCPQQHLQ